MRREKIRTPCLRWDYFADVNWKAINRFGFALQPTDFDPGSVGILRQNRGLDPGWLSLVDELGVPHGVNFILDLLAGAMGCFPMGC
jgi:hypothetical protein